MDGGIDDWRAFSEFAVLIDCDNDQAHLRMSVIVRVRQDQGEKCVGICPAARGRELGVI